MPGPGQSELERWARTKEVFLQALDLPPGERSVFVAGACSGDPDLLQEVRSLLASEQAAAEFCETPAAGLLGRPAQLAADATPHLAPGARLGVYEISAFLSAGGMGEVYRAQHTVLRRPVAIKTIPPHLADEAAKRRLLREARHASVLLHPNICTIHEVGEADGTPFIVMELVEGRPLSTVIRSGVPELSLVLAWGRLVADTLDHAHRHGIVHRDLKSSNIMIARDGRLVVLDFGLAKRLPGSTTAPTDSTVTGDLAVAGTLSHMAPEVLLGRPADERSDIWSLGVLLYEMATGTLPFPGRTSFETSSAILGEPPRPISGAVPLALRLVIERCLVKDPLQRYQRAADVSAALETIRRRRAWPLVGRLLLSARRRTLAGAAAALLLLVTGVSFARRLGTFVSGSTESRAIATLAFLPLENGTGDPAAGYYAAGLTEGLFTQLSNTAAVRLIAPGSAAQAAPASSNPAELARRLAADAILTGRLRQASGRIAVDLVLVEASRGRVLWSDAFERDPRQVLVLQADVVWALAAAVRLSLRPGSGDRLATVRSVSPEAYEEYLKGRYEWNRRTPPSLERAITHFTRAIELDATYAPAHASLADCYNQLGTVMVGSGPPLEYRRLAAAAAIRALQIDPLSAEAHATLGYVRHYDWRWAEAEQELRRAIELDPSYPLARIWYANLLMSRRRMDEALAQVRTAQALDPFSLVVNTNVGWVLTASGRADEAIAHLEQTLDLDSTYSQAQSRLVDALVAAGRYEEALDRAEWQVHVSSRSTWALAGLARVFVRVGRLDEARTLLAEILARARSGYVPPFTIANVHANLGNLDSALVWMTRAVEERSNGIAYFAIDSLGPMQQDPRFRALVAPAKLWSPP